ncbi:MAG: hypothetical protein A3C30_00965 [Candidatus Levybacteria bacterium RIFCSPHIGHO2_02_FULL_40_18]|nr:MAG: hypothetical protein A2869_02145 [Candidatus Levybacteria bacterium RIFCSPHIGHO2_01_FULL_40_58]OGH27268.1 MAG: hypothetical protein A3C30_00965 [Candidatus Levybacteria bacterium RIFCSPHIGHO2_02_FULL_40_18]OGH31951.1 MAG: hypothetical protein A3E43_01160 [Candidatus Levybacteria bacterium RIFCSPHIGHO2_12_FULL_40_31]OGH40705.1 MAG: hypothetical protein A2894_03065 [Candidatus Levybacteria bacterium RIFCSPLOWO2_01_FULL_40_64]OGH49344.1 MAG: hypothetical protein A3I54_01705 [Candidatus Lev
MLAFGKHSFNKSLFVGVLIPQLCGVHKLWMAKLVPQNGCGPQPNLGLLVLSWAASAAPACSGITP